MSGKVRLAIVGAGVMGSNHARIARQIDDVDVVAVVDADKDRAEATAALSGCRAVGDIGEVLSAIDAAVVALPTACHFDTTMRLIEAGCHVLVEKPIATSVRDGQRMTAAAAAKGLKLAVGHVERFNPPITELASHVHDPLHFRAERTNPYSNRIGDGVILDLMIHDLDILLMLAGTQAEVVHTAGIALHARGETEDLASVSVSFDSGLTATLAASRLGQQKVRRIDVTCRDSVVIADLLRQDLTVHRMTHAEYLSGEGTRYRQTGVVEIPFIEARGEPLALELRHFISAILHDHSVAADGAAGVRSLDLALRLARCVHRTEAMSELRT